MPKLPLSVRNFLRRRKPPQVLWRAFGFGLIKSMNALMATLNYRVYRYDRTADPADPSFYGPAIYVFWHEYIPCPVYLRPHCDLAMLLSQHQDAEILSHVAHFAGLQTVRGSTSRGGTAALRELIERGKGMSLAITPDGPRGPRRELAQGCIYLSGRLQIPIVPIGFGFDRPWRNRRAWDHFAIPRPFTRCRAVLGPRLQIPSGLDRPELEEHRQWVEDCLLFVTEQAEDWASGNYDLQGSEPLCASSARRNTPHSSAPSENAIHLLPPVPGQPLTPPLRVAS